MAKPAKTRSASRTPPRRAFDPGPPHPSWHQALAGSGRPAGGIASAGDFWARLGI